LGQARAKVRVGSGWGWGQEELGGGEAGLQSLEDGLGMGGRQLAQQCDTVLDHGSAHLGRVGLRLRLRARVRAGARARARARAGG
jgi:hypothetical protein